MRSLKGRLIVSALAWTALALVVIGLVIFILLREFVERTFDSRLSATLVAIMATVEYGEDGVLTRTRDAGEPAFERVFSGWYWQIEADGQALRSRSLWDQRLSVVGNQSAEPAVASPQGPQGERLRALVRRFTAPGGGAPLRLIVAGPQAEIDGSLSSILPPLAASLALLGCGLAGAIWLQVRVGLRPLARLSTGIEQVRHGEAARLDVPKVTELGPIAQEMNALISQNAEIIARTRTHVGNLAHALQTPLAAMANMLSDGSRDPGPDPSLAQMVERMRALVTHHLKRARAAASVGLIGTRTPVAPVVDDLADVLRRIYRDRNLSITAAIAPDIAFAGERQDLEEMIGNLLDNACKWAGAQVTVAASRDGPQLLIDIVDDGPGLDADEANAALARGRRLDESVDGYGLGLAIVEDLARLYGGHLDLDPGLAGLRARLVLPATPKP